MAAYCEATYPKREKMNSSEASKKIRELLGTKEPKLHKIPRWLLRRIVKNYEWIKTQDQAKQEIHRVCTWFLDHFGELKEDGRTLFVVEPYGPSKEQLKSAEDFAEKLGIKWYTTPESWWYPGRTYRIAFYEPNDNA